MGLKGKLVVSMEVKCGGHLFHDLCQTKPHHLSNISPNNVTGFDLHEGEIGEVGSVVTWKYKEDGNAKIAKCVVIEVIDDEKKSSTWKLIGGDLLEAYNAFIVNISCYQHYITWTLEYEKKTEDTPEPITFLGYVTGLIKDVEDHHVKK
ncbi:kirola-like [Nicotiana tabacum]|uniref:Kirola-like n=2 Tax=Nicotiana TaxID=4085 RepID=A0A1S3Y4R8_TOBAC|nr:PREDICTED: kirola-like [Nicotiana sylvestris]XP_016447146.1 PREDICTED: kirola-like [Nicotiana tabacum]